MGTRCAILVNPALSHQLDHARAWRAGLKRHGVDLVVTHDRDYRADLLILSGPNYAPARKHGDNVLYIDRAYWGDPDSVSIHWLNNGEKVYTGCTAHRPHPALMPYRTDTRRIFLADYGCKPFGRYDAVRMHPADGGAGSLQEALQGYGVAVGRRTTALVDAAIAGLVVDTDDENSPVWPIRGLKGNRGDWITCLAWHNWSLTEIEEGDAWAYLSQQRLRQDTPSPRQTRGYSVG